MAERVAGASSGFGADDSVHSASGVIARNLYNELKDLASVAKTQQDVLHMFGWSDDECLGVQIGWVLLCSRCTPLRGQSSRGIEDEKNQSSCPSSLLRTRGHRTARLW